MADSPRIEELKRRVQSDPASIAFAALAEEYRRAGRFEEAIDTCTAGLVRHPSYLSAHVTLGRALIDVGRLEDASNELQHVLKLAPENLAAIRGLAEIHDRLGVEADTHPPEEAAETSSAPEMTVAEIHAASGFSSHETEVSASTPVAFATPEQPGGPVAASQEVGSASDPVPTEGWGQAGPARTEVGQFAPVTVAGAPSTPDRSAHEPVLAGLEHFLHAIQRARAERAGTR